MLLNRSCKIFKWVHMSDLKGIYIDILNFHFLSSESDPGEQSKIPISCQLFLTFPLIINSVSHTLKIICFLMMFSYTSGWTILPSKLLDCRYRVQFPVALVDLAVRRSLQNSLKYGLGFLRKDPPPPHKPRPNIRTIDILPIVLEP